MKLRVIVLGAGFGGLELSSVLYESVGEDLDLTLIDQNDSFYFGFSKLDVMFGRKSGIFWLQSQSPLVWVMPDPPTLKLRWAKGVRLYWF